MSDHHLFRMLGEIKRGVARLDERMVVMAVDEAEVQQALEGLRNDLSAKMGEISSEVQTIESNINAGAPADLSALKALVDSVDADVQGFQLPSSTTAGGTAGGGGAGGGTEPAPAGAGGTAEPAGAGGAPTSAKPLYKHVGEGPIDSTQWTPATVTAEDGSQLFEFAGDTAGSSSPAGASAEWEVYTGTTQAAGPGGV